MSATGEVKSIAVIGAGLSGTMTAALLSDMGFKVTIFEKRIETPIEDEKSSSEFGNAANATKRSINLALSHRGILALERLGLVPEIMENAIPMPKRVIHGLDGSQKLQAYGKPGQSLYSVSRNGLNDSIKEYIRKANKGVAMHFGYTLVSIDRHGKCVFHTSTNQEHVEVFDLVIGADGAYSAVRDNILKQGRINFMRKFIRHGYKELTIPPVKDSKTGELTFALDDFEGLHIWPRGEFMLIALPNPDKSFTATLFAPWNGPFGFDKINLKDTNEIDNYFKTHFPDAYKLMPNAIQDFQVNPVGSLMTLKLDPWNFGRVCMIGDAAHAVVPFFGQGMNAAFQDAYILCDIIGDALAKSTLQTVDLTSCIAQFAEVRTPAANALSDICLEHYHDMAQNTASSLYLMQKKVESVLSAIFPNTFIPFYTMVAFTSMPYHEALARGARQDTWVRRICLASLVGLGVGAYALHSKRGSFDVKSFFKFN